MAAGPCYLSLSKLVLDAVLLAEHEEKAFLAPDPLMHRRLTLQPARLFRVVTTVKGHEPLDVHVLCRLLPDSLAGVVGGDLARGIPVKG